MTHTHSTASDYFVRDQASSHKLEYYNGIIIAQAGATARHNLIVANVIGHLHAQVRRNGCHLFASDMRVQAIDQQVYTYPDITIVCGTPQFAEPSEMTLLNPTLIIEILSPATEARDRTEKFIYYRQIDSLKEYILIGQNLPYVQRYTRQTAHLWYVHLNDDLAGQVSFEAVGGSLSMSEIYDGVTF